jgi:toxin CcdB
MAQFDIHENADPRSRERTPYLIDLQTEILSELATRVVAPVRPRAEHEHTIISRLHPIISVNGVEHVVAVSELAAIPVSLLGPPVASARSERTAITGATDLLLTGF